MIIIFAKVASLTTIPAPYQRGISVTNAVLLKLTGNLVGKCYSL
jgi:hypothetical protein